PLVNIGFTKIIGQHSGSKGEDPRDSSGVVARDPLPVSPDIFRTGSQNVDEILLIALNPKRAVLTDLTRIQGPRLKEVPLIGIPRAATEQNHSECDSQP